MRKIFRFIIILQIFIFRTLLAVDIEPGDMVVVSWTGRTVAVVNSDGFGKAVLQKFAPGNDGYYDVAWAPDGSVFYVTNYLTNVVEKWDGRNKLTLNILINIIMEILA